MEVNNDLVNLVDINELYEEKKEWGFETIRGGFNQTVETALGRSYDYVDRQANNEIVKGLEDYNDNKISYDSYLFLPPVQKQKHMDVIKEGMYTLDENGDVVAGEGVTFFDRILTNTFSHLDKGALKGAILMQSNGVTQDMIDDKFKDIHQKNVKKYQGQTYTTGGDIAHTIGAIGAYTTEPEFLLEVFGVPSKILGENLLKNMGKAFGTEFAVASIAEAIRQFKPTGVVALNRRAKIDYTLTDGATQVLINASLAGSLRALGSGVEDTVILNQIKKRSPDKNAQEIFARWNKRQLSKTVLNQKAYNLTMRELSDNLDENKMPDLETDIDIMAKTDPEVEAVNIQDEARIIRDQQGYVQNGKLVDEEVEAATKDPEDLTFEDNMVNRFEEFEDEIKLNPEVQQLKKELDELENSDIIINKDKDQ